MLGTKLPGPGTIYLGQTLRFLKPVSIGDTITAHVTVQDKAAAHHGVTLDCFCVNQLGETVITGVADVRAPVDAVRLRAAPLPTVRIDGHR